MTDEDSTRVSQRRRPKRKPILARSADSQKPEEPLVPPEATKEAPEPQLPQEPEKQSEQGFSPEKQVAEERPVEPASEEEPVHVTGPIFADDQAVIDTTPEPTESGKVEQGEENIERVEVTPSPASTTSDNEDELGWTPREATGESQEEQAVESRVEDAPPDQLFKARPRTRRQVLVTPSDKLAARRGKGIRKKSNIEQVRELQASNLGQISRPRGTDKRATRTTRGLSIFRKASKESIDDTQRLLKSFKESSALVRISLKFFRNFLSKRVDKYAKLETNLKKSKMPYSSIQYLSTVYFVSLIVACSIGGFIVIFADLLGPYWILPVVFGAVAIMGFAGVYLGRPSSLAKKRKKDIDAKIPMAIGYIATMASADMPIDNILFELGQSREYGEIAKEARSISMASRFFGKDIITAMRDGAKNSPSPKFSEFLQGIVTTVTSGGNLKVYFKSKAVQYQSELSTVIRTNAESIGILAESYVTVGVAFPLMLIVILGVVAALGSSSGGMVIVLYLIDLMIIPLITVTFAFLVSSTIKEVNL
ncbi:MAG: type II secretion system F family protein [Candidatus Thermoplasmatota archaeon]|nr:type II secretion system F family protein [Candidatus Thermoplasmatota archaeon]